MSSNPFVLGPYTPINLTNKGDLNKGLAYRFNTLGNSFMSGMNNRNQQQSGLQSNFSGLVGSGGYSPAEKANIEQGTLGGINSSYSSAADAAKRRFGITRNSAGYGSILENLARNKARDLSSAGLNVQSQFADEAYKRKLAGLQGLAQMYGVDTSFLNSLSGQQNELLNIGSGVQSRSRGVLGTIGAIGSLF